MSKKNVENLSFEQRLERLQNIVSILEKGSSTLEESMLLYKEGMEHSRFCKELLEKAQHEIKILENEELKDFLVQDISKEV